MWRQGQLYWYFKRAGTGKVAPMSSSLPLTHEENSMANFWGFTRHAIVNRKNFLHVFADKLLMINSNNQ